MTRSSSRYCDARRDRSRPHRWCRPPAWPAVIVPFSDLLGRARASGRAVGAFTVYGLDVAVAVLGAAERRRTGVVLLISAETFRSRSGRALAVGARALCEESPAECCLQLDHVAQLDLVAAGFVAGFGSVMVDGSRLAFQDNADLVRAASAIAAGHGGGIEAELGRVEGDEDASSGADVGLLTDPDEAAQFMATTGADCLAVSIGNVHGIFRAPPVLDLDRLEHVARNVTQPLSLHGASGIPEAALKDAIASGVSKVNVNTELRQSYFAALREHIAELEPGAQVLRLSRLISARVEATVYEKLGVFDTAD
jgi:ketose-bisphosphate aldolase